MKKSFIISGPGPLLRRKNIPMHTFPMLLETSNQINMQSFPARLESNVIFVVTQLYVKFLDYSCY